jgi:predicted methyltransferase
MIARLMPMLFVLLLAACAGFPEPDPERSAAIAREAAGASTVPGAESALPPLRKFPKPGADAGLAVAAAIDAPERLLTDRVFDAQRRPGEVLRFFGIRPGMTVLDLYSGGGYYTEILSFLVGPSGRVVAHNNTAYLEFAKKDLAARFTPGRLQNVERLVAENNELRLPPARFDAVLMSLSWHDVYHEDAGWPRIDGPRLLAEIGQAMKPGAVLGVIDHAAVTGAPAEVGGTLHRIDPERLRQDITRGGFVLEAESQVLRNPEDDHTKPIFDPAIRGRTDQVVMRFRKPR